MRAAVLHEVGAPLRGRGPRRSSRRAPARCRSASRRPGVCHSDYHYMTGDLRCPLPVVVGHEGAGVVEAVGAGVERVRAGRPRRAAVAAALRALRATASTGQPVLCRLGARAGRAPAACPTTAPRACASTAREVHHLMGVSCFAEQVVVSEKSVVPVPDGVPPHIAAITGCAVITGRRRGAQRGRRVRRPGAARRRRRRRRAVRRDGRAARRRGSDRRGRRRRRRSSTAPAGSGATHTVARRARGRRRGRCSPRARRRRLGDRGGRARGDARSRPSPACGRAGRRWPSGSARVGATFARPDQRAGAAPEARGRQPVRLGQPAGRPAAPVPPLPGRPAAARRAGRRRSTRWRRQRRLRGARPAAPSGAPSWCRRR